jgi:uncharacterized protein YbjQ (UPF0145 family)
MKNKKKELIAPIIVTIKDLTQSLKTLVGGELVAYNEMVKNPH